MNKQNKCARPLNIAVLISSYAVLPRSLSEQVGQSFLARDCLSFVPCVARSDGTHQQRSCRVWNFVKAHIAWKWPCECRGHFPVHRCGRWPTQRPMSAEPFLLWLWHNLCNAEPCDCAAPHPVPMQCRPCALMPVQCRSRCHDLHTLGPPHPFS